MGFKVKNTKLPSVIVISPERFNDKRGFFEESWNSSAFKKIGLDFNFVQDNHSYSFDAGTLRGLHFQSPPFAQDKLIRCTRGAIFDVAVDIRRGSSSYGEWIGEELSSQNGNQLLIPKGFLHGFITLVQDTEVQYKCSNYYSPKHDGSVLWSSLDIDWPLKEDHIIKISEKDRKAESFRNFNSPFEYNQEL